MSLEKDLVSSNEELTKMANDWTILGKDLISEVTCKEPYEWKDLTDEEWEFSKAAQAQAAEKPFNVRVHASIYSKRMVLVVCYARKIRRNVPFSSISVAHSARSKASGHRHSLAIGKSDVRSLCCIQPQSCLIGAQEGSWQQVGLGSGDRNDL